MSRTLCPEMDQWLERKQAAALPSPMPERKAEDVPPCPLNDREFAWLWDRYTRCSFPPATAAKRLAKTPLENLTLRGRNFAVRISHRFRRQILGKSAVPMTPDEFLATIRQCATGPLCKKCSHPGSFVRLRYFENSNSQVWECLNARCENHGLIWHVDNVAKSEPAPLR